MSKYVDNFNKSITNNVKSALNAVNSGNDKRDIKDFILAEGFLHFCYVNNLVKDVNGSYLLLANLHKMGKSKLGSFHFYLDNLRNHYYPLSSKINYTTIIKKYLDTPPSIRMYDIQNNNLMFIGEKINCTCREAYYNNLASKVYERPETKIKYDAQIESYNFLYNNNEINISFEDINLPKASFDKEREKRGGSYSITIDKLIKTAKEMDELIEEKISAGFLLKKEQYEKRIKNATIKAVLKGKLKITDTLAIDKVCNILGMVGAGKSTIMTVLAYAAAKDGYRIVIVLETVREVLDLAYLFETIGIKSTPIRGQRTVNDQIEKVTDGDEMFITRKYSSHLTGVCPLDGFLDRNDTFINIDYGKEPCCSLESEESDGTFLCPFYFSCPRKKDERYIQQADIIVTTVHNLIYGKSHFMKDYGKIPLMEYIISNIDMVMFDEADKVQVILDKIFCETASVAEILSSNSSQLLNIINKSIQGKTSSLTTAFMKEFVFSIGYLNDIRSYITENETISNIDRLKQGKWFSGLILTNSITEFNEKLRKDLQDYNINDKEIDLFNDYKNAYITMGSVEKEISRIREAYNLDKKGELFFKFIITLIFFESSIYKLSNILQQLNDINLDSFEIPDIFRTPFRALQKLIPTSPLGNRFGYVYDKEKNDITIFRQFGVGRSIMLDLPYLKLDSKGNPLGPHVVLFSGSSWAEGSYRYHINKDVSYILQSDEKIIDFIEKTECIVVPAATNVSGSKNKVIAIKDLINESRNYIEKQIESDGRILIIVNSYQQCLEAQKELKDLFSNVNICRLTSDKAKDEEDTIKRGKLNEFYKHNYKILIAPAMSIERGHNIVDEIGHSIFTSLFFLVRPMDVPRDIENIVSTINGAIYDYSSTSNEENLQIKINSLINKAYYLWDIMFRNYYTISNLEEISKKEIIVSRLVLIVQIFGRLLRIIDCSRQVPKIYFVDGAFSGSELNNFNLLDEILSYLENNMKREDVGDIVKMLYGPFYKALKGGILHV